MPIPSKFTRSEYIPRDHHHQRKGQKSRVALKKAATPDQQPFLPLDIERLIFILAAHNHPEMHRTLLLICYRVKVWVEPVVRKYMIIVISTCQRFHNYPRSPLHVRSVFPLRGQIATPATIQHNVTSLFLTLPSEPQFSSMFPNVNRLHLHLIPECLYSRSTFIELMPAVSGLLLEELSWNTPPFPNVADQMEEAIENFFTNLCIFHSKTLTHLALPSMSAIPPFLLQLDRLSHLTVLLNGMGANEAFEWMGRRRDTSVLEKLLSRPHFRLCILAGGELTEARCHVDYYRELPAVTYDGLIPNWRDIIAQRFGLDTSKIIWYPKPWSPADDFINSSNGEQTIWEIGEAMLKARQALHELYGLPA